jgi:hypothetical protein
LFGPETHAVAADLPALWFPVGEELVFRVYWAFLPIGKSRVKTAWVEEDGRRLLAIRYRTQTNRLFDKIYPINDFAEALIEPHRFLPVTFTVRTERRKLTADETVVFDHDRRVATWSSRLSGETREVPIDPDARDIITFMYHLRATGLDPQTAADYRVFGDDKMHHLHVETHGVDAIRLPVFGEVPSVKVEPRVEFRGLMIEDGRVLMWVSRDARHLATRLNIDAPFARVRALLCQVLGPGDDAWSRAMQEQGHASPCEAEVEIEQALQEIEQPAPGAARSP